MKKRRKSWPWRYWLKWRYWLSIPVVAIFAIHTAGMLFQGPPRVKAAKTPQWTVQFYKSFTGEPSHRHLMSYDPQVAMAEFRAYEGDQAELVTFCRYGLQKCVIKSFWRVRR